MQIQSLTFIHFNPCHQVQIQKNLMTRLRGKLENVYLKPKMPHLPILGIIRTFLKKQAVTFTCLLNPNCMQKIRKK